MSRASTMTVCLALLASAAVLAGGCGRKKSGQSSAGADLSSIPVQTFKVDTTLLGPAVSDSTLRITFRPPSIFEAIPPARAAQIRAAVEQNQKPGDSLAAVPVLLFGRPGNVGLCTVSRLVLAPAGGMTPAWIAWCRQAVRRQTAPAAVTDSLFRVGADVALRFEVRNPKMVLYRLIRPGPGGALVQVDFLTPLPDFDRTVPAIESSIGSMIFF